MRIQTHFFRVPRASQTEIDSITEKRVSDIEIFDTKIKHFTEDAVKFMIDGCFSLHGKRIDSTPVHQAMKLKANVKMPTLRSISEKKLRLPKDTVKFFSFPCKVFLSSIKERDDKVWKNSSQKRMQTKAEVSDDQEGRGSCTDRRYASVANRSRNA